MVSVIIAVYNGEKFVNRAIASVLNQDIEDIEVIIVDDCSKDNTRDVIYGEYGSLIGKRIFYHRNWENLERSRSRNLGFDLSRGDYVFFLDYDDEWEKDYIRESLEYLKDYDIVYSIPRSFIDKDSKILRVSRKAIPQEAEKLVFFGYIGYPSASAFKRSSFLRYREDVILREDWEIYLRSYFSGLKIGILDNNKVRIREHGNRSSRNVFMLSATMKIYEE
ncbi:MAG: glycosyltransferase family 2 protein [Aquificaceae bacterium]